LSDSIRIYFDVKDIETAYKELNGDEAVLDIVSFKVYESSSKGGTYKLIDTVPYDSKLSYVETLFFSDMGNWYKLSYISGDGSESSLSEPTISEEISNLIDNIIIDMQDTDRDNPAFNEEQYISKIRDAYGRLTQEDNLSYLREKHFGMISLLTRISCCYDLAYRNSGNFPIGLPDGISIDKGARVEHYLSIARGLENQYTQIKNDVGQVDIISGEVSGNPKLNSTEATRKTYFRDASRIRGNRYAI